VGHFEAITEWQQMFRAKLRTAEGLLDFCGEVSLCNGAR
jgi:hypothetical protein